MPPINEDSQVQSNLTTEPTPMPTPQEPVTSSTPTELLLARIEALEAQQKSQFTSADLNSRLDTIESLFDECAASYRQLQKHMDELTVLSPGTVGAVSNQMQDEIDLHKSFLNRMGANIA